jgi:hypothetical protein
MRRYRGYVVDSERWERFAFRSDDVVISTPANLRPTDYEFDPALSPTSKIERREWLTSGFSPQSSPTLRNVFQSVAGPMRDTSRAGLAERRKSELLCIRTSERVRLNQGLLAATESDAWRSDLIEPMLARGATAIELGATSSPRRR